MTTRHESQGEINLRRYQTLRAQLSGMDKNLFPHQLIGALAGQVTPEVWARALAIALDRGEPDGISKRIYAAARRIAAMDAEPVGLNAQVERVIAETDAVMAEVGK